MKKVLILGSTGSIGIQALEVIAAGDGLQVAGLSAGSSWEPLLDQAREHGVPAVALADTEAAARAGEEWSGRVLPGEEGIRALIDGSGADLVLNAIVGAAGLGPTIVALTASWWLTRRLAIMPLVTGIVVFIFGGLTLLLQDEIFIKMKPTIVNVLFGTTLLVGLWFGRPLLGYVFDSVFRLDDEGWRKLTFRWGVFFFVLALLNEVIWRNFSTDFWVTFKVFGIMPLTVLFTLTQMPLIQRHALPEKS